MIHGKLQLEPPKPFMTKSGRDLKTIWPQGTDINDWLKLQNKLLRKTKDPELKYKIKLIIEEFESIKELL